VLAGQLRRIHGGVDSQLALARAETDAHPVKLTAAGVLEMLLAKADDAAAPHNRRLAGHILHDTDKLPAISLLLFVTERVDKCLDAVTVCTSLQLCHRLPSFLYFYYNNPCQRGERL